MNRIKTDICIIGGGSGGLSIAAGAVQMGAKVVLLEGHKMGGDCLNYGCVPSKALIASAKQAHAMSHGAKYGVGEVEAQVDYAPEFTADSEVQADAFGMSDMQITVRFRREARTDAGVFARCQILSDDLADEVVFIGWDGGF